MLGGTWYLDTATSKDEQDAAFDPKRCGVGPNEANVIFGIDIGASGAVALPTGAGDLVGVYDMPVLNDGPSGRRAVNAPLLAEIVFKSHAATLRQLFYQFVARNLIQNTQSEYKRLGHIIVAARRAGLIDWAAIEDRTRNVQSVASWRDPPEIVKAIADQYREDLWGDQPFRPEVWIEKEGLLGVIEGACREYRVPYFACRGNNSETEQYWAGKRFAATIASDCTPIVLHLGDHDASGIDMTRDNRDRLEIFAREPIEVRCLALSFDQVQRYRLPPNPAKETDSRFAAYAEQFGEASWELDDLDPTVIVELIRAELENLIDVETWNEALSKETANPATLGEASKNWAEVEKYLRREARNV